MPTKGEVYALRRRIGFDGMKEANLLVLQGARTSRILDTVVVAPLVAASPLHRENVYAVPVPRAESGLGHASVAILYSLSTIPQNLLTPMPNGCLAPETIARIDAVLAELFDLP